MIETYTCFYWWYFFSRVKSWNSSDFNTVAIPKSDTLNLFTENNDSIADILRFFPIFWILNYNLCTWVRNRTLCVYVLERTENYIKALIKRRKYVYFSLIKCVCANIYLCQCIRIAFALNTNVPKFIVLQYITFEDN